MRRGPIIVLGALAALAGAWVLWSPAWKLVPAPEDRRPLRSDDASTETPPVGARGVLVAVMLEGPGGERRPHAVRLVGPLGSDGLGVSVVVPSYAAIWGPQASWEPADGEPLRVRAADVWYTLADDPGAPA